MLYIILVCAAIMLAVFALLLSKSLLYKDSTGKTRFTAKNLTVPTVVSKLFWALIGAFVIIYIVSLILPLVWMVMSAVKSSQDFQYHPFQFPESIHLENFVNVFSKIKVTQNGVTYNIYNMFVNSIFYASVKPLVSVFWMTVVAYVLARFKFFGSKFIYNLGIFIMMVPITGSIASKMIIYSNIGLYDNLVANTLMPPSTPFSGMYFMILYGSLKGIPQTYSEAAYIDGANEYRVMFRIIIPMIIPACVTIYILEFITFWNVYQDFLIWFPSSPNIAYGMLKFQEQRQGSGGISTPELISGLMIIMVPSLVLYLSGQKLMQSNFTLGGLKG